MQKYLSIMEDILNVLSKMNESIDEAWGDSTPRKERIDKDVESGAVRKKTVNMSPDEYIRKAVRTTRPTVRSTKSTIKSTVADRESDKDSIDYHTKGIKSEDTRVNKPYLDYTKAEGGQEGLHRAIAAKKAGEKFIPVDIYHSTKKGGNVSRIDKVNARKQVQAEKAERKRKEEEDRIDAERRRKDREAHPEKYERKRGYSDTEEVLGKGW